MLLGMIHDEQFGPVVVLGFGGLHVEALADVVYALPPFDAAEARRLVDRLRLAPLLHSRRHKRPLAVDEFCQHRGALLGAGRRHSATCSARWT